MSYAPTGLDLTLTAWWNQELNGERRRAVEAVYESVLADPHLGSTGEFIEDGLYSCTVPVPGHGVVLAYLVLEAFNEVHFTMVDDLYTGKRFCVAPHRRPRP